MARNRKRGGKKGVSRRDAGTGTVAGHRLRFSVTRICPTDMLFQRMGRLWRHDEGPSQMRRPAGACREAWILTPGSGRSPAKSHEGFRQDGITSIAHMSCAARSNNGRNAVAFDCRTTSGQCSRPPMRIGTRRGRPWRLRCGSWRRISGRCGTTPTTVRLSGAIPFSEETVTTRAMQRPEADVLLLRSRGMNGGQCLLADGSEVTFPARSPEWRERARIASRLMANIVRVPENWLENVHRPSADLLNRLSPYLYVAPKDGGRPSLYIAALRADGTLEDGFGKRFRRELHPGMGLRTNNVLLKKGGM